MSIIVGASCHFKNTNWCYVIVHALMITIVSLYTLFVIHKSLSFQTAAQHSTDIAKAQTISKYKRTIRRISHICHTGLHFSMAIAVRTDNINTSQCDNILMSITDSQSQSSLDSGTTPRPLTPPPTFLPSSILYPVSEEQRVEKYRSLVHLLFRVTYSQKGYICSITFSSTDRGVGPPPPKKRQQELCLTVQNRITRMSWLLELTRTTLMITRRASMTRLIHSEI